VRHAYAGMGIVYVYFVRIYLTVLAHLHKILWNAQK
jgi:hypothetical protein